MNGHPYAKIERENAIAACASNLSHAIAMLRAVRQLDQHHQLGLDLPPEQALLDAFSRCVSLHRQAKAPLLP